VFATLPSPRRSPHLSASDDGTARVWRIDSAGEVIILRGLTGKIVNAAFSADGTRIVTAGDAAAARVWRVSWPMLLDVLRAAGHSCLTPQERRQYLGERADDAQRQWKKCETDNGR
jgi:WD40 repeat protein